MLQDLYPDDFAHCYGCGRLNTNGLHVKSEWTDGEAIARFKPAPYHMALPGFVYGGLIASLADCHAMATAAAASMVAAGALPGRDPTPRFVTASLHVEFLRPTPLGPELLIRARAVEVGKRKVVVELSVIAEGAECARSRVVAVRAPMAMVRGGEGTEGAMARSPRIMSWRWGRVFIETAPGPLRDVVLFPGGAREWDWRASGTSHRAGIQPSAVVELMGRGARILVLSRGVLGALRVAPATLALLAERGVPVHVLRTPEAIERYNALATTEPVGALIHSTC